MSDAKILVVGCGNPLRSDDAVGVEVVERIAGRKIKGVDTLVLQQLNVEHLEDFIRYLKVIVVDASVEGMPLEFQKIEPVSENGLASSHHLNPGILAALASKLYGVRLNLHLCSIRGESFEMGSGISHASKLRSDEAFDLLMKDIEKELSHA